MSNQIMITLNQIKACDPCAIGWRKLLAAQGKMAPDGVEFPLSDILETNDLGDCLWALRCTSEQFHPLWRKFAVWAARQVEHLMGDERSKAALEVAWRHSNGEASDKELHAAGAAAWAAARDAAWAAAWAAARDAAWAAAGSAAWAAASYAQAKKLKQILDAGEWVE